jgi:predicted porin
MKRSGQLEKTSRLGKWCKLGYALLPAAFGSEMSHAQSSVTLYGVADISVRYLSNADKAGNGRFPDGAGRHEREPVGREGR